MDQVKVGKFIAYLRRREGMMQDKMMMYVEKKIYGDNKWQE